MKTSSVKMNAHISSLNDENRGRIEGFPLSTESLLKDSLSTSQNSDFLKPYNHHKVKRLDARKDVRNLPKITNTEIQKETEVLQSSRHSHHSHHINKKDKSQIKIVRAYLKFVIAFQSIRFWAAHLKHNQRIDDALHQKAGNIIICLLRKRVGITRHKFGRLNTITAKYGLNWIIKYRCRKKRKAVLTLGAFLTDLFSYRLPVMLAQLRLSAVRLQRQIRSFCRVTEARRKVLSMLWTQLEKHYNTTLIPLLQEKIEAQRQKRAQKKIEEAKGKEKRLQGIKVETSLFPTLVDQINTASFLMARLNYTMQKGQKLIDRCPPDSIHKGAVQSNAQERAQKKKELIARYIEDARHSYKMTILNEKVEAQIRKSGQCFLTVEDAKRMIQSESTSMEHELLFAKNNKVLVSKYPSMLVYTGSKRLEFQRIVEDFLRADLGLPSRESLPSPTNKRKSLDIE